MSNLSTILGLLKDKLPDNEVRQIASLVASETIAAKDLWMKSQVRARNIIAGLGFAAGVVAGVLIAPLL